MSSASRATNGSSPAPVRALIGNTSSTISSSPTALRTSAVWGVFEPVALVDRADHRPPLAGLEERLGDEAVARADPLLPVDDEQHAIGVGELVFHAALHPPGERIARALHARQIDEHELPPGGDVGGDSPHGAPGRLRPVGDDRHLGADDRVHERRLADVGPPGQSDEAGASHAGRPVSGASGERDHHLRLQGEHLAGVRLVVVAAQVQHAVNRRLGEVGGVLGADHDVAQLAWAGDLVGAVDRKRQHVGGLVPAPVLAVQLADPARVHQLDREVAVLDAGGRERCQRGWGELVRHVGVVDQTTKPLPGWPRCFRDKVAHSITGASAPRARRRPRRSAARAGAGRRPRRRSGRTRCRRSRRGCRRRRSAPSAGRAAGRPG